MKKTTLIAEKGHGPVIDPRLVVTPWRVLWVGAWPAGADPSIYFRSITDAITQAATMNPTSTNQVSIVIFPGIYTEDLTLLSNVNYVGLPAATLATVMLNGSVTWTPGVGLNQPQAADTEQINWNSIDQSLNNQNKFTFDSTGKTAGSAQFFSAHSAFEIVSFTGRGNPQTGDDNSFFYAGTFFLGPGPVTFTNMQGAVTPAAGVEIECVRFRGLNLAGSTICRIQSGENVVPKQATSIALTETAQCFAQGVNFQNPITVASGCSFVADGCVLNNTLTVAAGGTADIRATNFVSNANLLGAGTIDRSEWLGVAGPTVAGVPLVVPLTPNFPDNVYNVSLQLTAGPGNAGTTVTAKLGDSFTITDAVGGNTFDYTLIHGG